MRLLTSKQYIRNLFNSNILKPLNTQNLILNCATVVFDNCQIRHNNRFGTYKNFTHFVNIIKYNCSTIIESYPTNILYDWTIKKYIRFSDFEFLNKQV